MTRSVEEIRRLLVGPVNSIPTSFHPDGAIDWDGIANIIEVGIASGSQVSLLTYGDSQMEFLSDEETEQLTRFLVERVGDRTLTVAATRRWSTQRMVEFARFSQDSGADVLMVLPSEMASVAAKVEQYRAVAEVTPVMLVGWPCHGILDQLLDVANICCFKEDGSLEYAAQTLEAYGDHWSFLTGGGLWRNYAQWPWTDAFFCFFASFAPHVVREYARAARDRDAVTAIRIIRELERPLFALVDRAGGNFQSLWRVALELNGIAHRGLRHPMATATAEQVEVLRQPLEELGLITHPL
ncbi:MAG: dihydrodipicolinate synthase family protein [Candidatus Latescibacterota bacterium]|nr:dihydrodipicolinate synthase family protein [Candidatus Latescibacterota bacterium]